MSFIRRQAMPPPEMSSAAPLPQVKPLRRAQQRRDMANAALGGVVGALSGLILSVAPADAIASPTWPIFLGAAGASIGRCAATIAGAVRRRLAMPPARGGASAVRNWFTKSAR